MSRGEKRSRSAEGRGRERGVVVISLSVARRGNRARSFVSHASRTSLPPPPSLPVREGHLSTWHYAAVNVQITPHLLHSKQRSFNDTRTGGGTVVNFSRDQTLSLSFIETERKKKVETKKEACFSSKRLLD